MNFIFEHPVLLLNCVDRKGKELSIERPRNVHYKDSKFNHYIFIFDQNVHFIESKKNKNKYQHAYVGKKLRNIPRISQLQFR